MSNTAKLLGNLEEDKPMDKKEALKFAEYLSDNMENQFEDEIRDFERLIKFLKSL